jgi:hypothetical protein
MGSNLAKKSIWKKFFAMFSKNEFAARSDGGGQKKLPMPPLAP